MRNVEQFRQLVAVALILATCGITFAVSCIYIFASEDK